MMCYGWRATGADAAQMKIEHADDDTIIDDTAGRAYVEQFAQQTFDRGEKVLRADKVTR